MGLGDVLPKGPLLRRIYDRAGGEEPTISDLEDEFGEEAVRRGISYMESLSEADENYKDSADKDKAEEAIEDAYGEEASAPDEYGESWEEGMRDSGLGLENDS